MLINSTFYLVVTTAVPAVLGIGIAWQAWKKQNKRRMLVAILAGGFAWGGFQAMAGRLYIADEVNDVSDYRTLGSVNFAMANGKNVIIPYSPRKVQVLNNSAGGIVLEEIKYGSFSPLGPKISFIAPYDTATFDLRRIQIDFFFDDKIPNEIEVYGSQDESRYWLHR